MTQILRISASIKWYICRYPPALGLVFEDGEEKGDREGSPVPVLRYGPPPEPYKPPTQVDLCQAWLVALLEEAGEPLRSSEVYALGREASFSHGVVYRARRALEGRIVDTDVLRSPKNRWRLAGEGGADERRNA